MQILFTLHFYWSAPLNWDHFPVSKRLFKFFPVPRIQFLAVEIARNREGHNNCLREKYKKGKDVKSWQVNLIATDAEHEQHPL